MEHSIAAKFAARPAARFVRPSTRARQRRLGLRSTVSFRAAPGQATVLRNADLGALVRLRANWRSIRAARPRRSMGGQPRPLVTMEWARSGRPGSPRRSSAPSAPWRG
ncbi:MAG: hypothetical protein ACJ77B_01130 [Chloroflexota bacterium]